MNGREQRRPLPEGLRAGARDFFAELRQVVDEAGLSTRELERRTSTPRTGTDAPVFYSKSQWSRWLNGQSVPPRRAVERAAAVLRADGVAVERLLDLHRQTVIPAQRADGGQGHQAGREGGDGHGALPPRQVPTVTPDFTGRAQELADLDQLATQAEMGGGAAVVVIAGTAGVGKTTLARHFCQRAAARFPDGQLYVNLRGFDPGGQPLDPSTALRGFLEALGVGPESVRDDIDAQAALFRTLAAGRRLLIAVDNARDEEQVRPLIPGTAGCLVVVTSRSSLAGLLAQGARGLTLAPFSTGEAREFLVRRLGAITVDRDPEAVTELIERCAGLPLALSVAAARPGFPLAALAGELRGRALDQLETGDRETSVRAVFSWSYDALSDEGKRMFRLLGVDPGPEVSVPAAASLAALPAAQARMTLRGLALAHLAEEHPAGRFTMHDLLRAYAAELAASIDGQDAVDEAELRLLDHYLHTAYAAVLLRVPAIDFGDLDPPAAGLVIDPPATAEAAMAWFATESRPLIAACARAAERRLPAHSWRLPLVVAPYLIAQGRLAESGTMLRAALSAAELVGDLRGRGHVHYRLAQVLDITGDSEEAAAHLRQALNAFTATGDRPGQGLALYGLARVLEGQDRQAEALPFAREALRVRAEHGTPATVATTENLLASICARLGLYAEAIEHCQRSLRISEEAGLRLYRGGALYHLGMVHFLEGDYPAAAGRYEQAAETYREISSIPELATTLWLLADAREAAGDPAEAARNRATVQAMIDDMPPEQAGRFRDWIKREAPPLPADQPAAAPGPPADHP